MIWGVILALPAVATIFLVAKGRGPGTWTLLAVTSLISGCGIPVLIREGRLLAESSAAEESRRRKDQFRDAIKLELRSKPVGQVDLDSLEIECRVSREESESVVDELYRRMVDRVVADGVINPEERKRLNQLARALRLPASRRERLEGEGASARYHQALDEAYADGIITAEEARMLDEMRTNLGIEE